jgi:hypothetical protein
MPAGGRAARKRPVATPAVDAPAARRPASAGAGPSGSDGGVGGWVGEEGEWVWGGKGQPGQGGGRLALVLFAGEAREDNLPEQLGRRGFRVLAVDTARGGQGHDVARPEVWRAIWNLVRSGEVACVFMGKPRASYSVAHRPQLRSRRSPEGIPAALASDSAWRAYLLKHNRLAALTAELAHLADGLGIPWAIENPADRGVRSSPAWWAAHADHAPLWAMPCMWRLMAATGACELTFAQCAFGAAAQKWTTVWCARSLQVPLAPLHTRSCAHGHEVVAHGRDAEGAWHGIPAR